MIQSTDLDYSQPMVESSNRFPFQTNPQDQKGKAIDKSRELVLLTHGIASPRMLLYPLARRLRTVGYSTRVYGYNSIWYSIRTHAKKFVKVVHRASEGYDKIHLVVHSMGGIITRCALEQEMPMNLGRIVMIAPPNRGSHIATRNAPWHGWFSPPVLEMRDTPDSLVNQLGPLPPGREVGVLAASNDNVIRPGMTEVEGQADHRTVKGWHTGILWSTETADLTNRFLSHGSFGRI